MTTKAQLINSLATTTGLSRKEVAAFVAAYSSEIVGTLAAGGQALIPGVGKLKVQERSARTGRNPRTGEALQIPARKTVRLVPSKVLKVVVNT